MSKAAIKILRDLQEKHKFNVASLPASEVHSALEDAIQMLLSLSPPDWPFGKIELVIGNAYAKKVFSEMELLSVTFKESTLVEMFKEVADEAIDAYRRSKPDV